MYLVARVGSQTSESGPEGRVPNFAEDIFICVNHPQQKFRENFQLGPLNVR